MATAVWLVFVIMLQIASVFTSAPDVWRKIIECVYIIAHTYLHLVQSTLCDWKVLSCFINHGLIANVMIGLIATLNVHLSSSIIIHFISGSNAHKNTASEKTEID